MAKESPLKTGKTGQMTGQPPGAPAAQTAPTIVVIHGPNLNLLGEREPHIYGNVTLADIDAQLAARGRDAGVVVVSLQSNHEGALIDRVQRARGEADARIINAGGFTHTSVALRDAIAATKIPTIEVHLSNLAAREEFRQHSYLTAVCVGQISGFGAASYRLALDAAIDILVARGRVPDPHAKQKGR